MSVQGGKTAPSKVTPFSAFAPEPTISQRQVYIANQQLQRHLDVERLLSVFFDLCNKLTVVDGLDLIVPEGVGPKLRLNQGVLTQHKAKYNLSIDGTPIGILSFHRRKRFREQELANLETLQGALIYPLKNALMYERLLRESQLDPLTNLGNRRAFDQHFERECAIAKRYQSPLSLIILDIDHFKQINDRHGHKVGDLALIECTKRLQKGVRQSDTCFRLGGEEFAVLLRNTGLDQAKQVADRALDKIRAKPLNMPKARIKLTCSAGLSEFEGDPSKLFDFADQALYIAKSSGRDQAHIG